MIEKQSAQLLCKDKNSLKQYIYVSCGTYVSNFSITKTCD